MSTLVSALPLPLSSAFVSDAQPHSETSNATPNTTRYTSERVHT